MKEGHNVWVELDFVIKNGQGEIVVEDGWILGYIMM